MSKINSSEKKEEKTILTDAYLSHKKSLDLRAFRKIGNSTTSEDLVQETFVKTWKYLVKGGKIETMKAFLCHVLDDLIVDEYRKNKTTSLDVLLAKGYEPAVGHLEHNFNALDGKAAILLIQQLPEKYQKVMHMRYVRDLSLKEISLITGQTTNATAVQVHRGLEKLKILYTPPRR